MVKVDEKPVGALGRIVIPESLRQSLDFEPGVMVSIYVDGHDLVLRSELTRGPACRLCSSLRPTIETINGHKLCQECHEKLTNGNNAGGG